MERHGEEPEVICFDSPSAEEEEIRRLVERFRGSGYHMMAIICKKQAQAKALHALLKASDVFLLTEESTFFRAGIVITTAPMAKGLEFDEVLVPFASSENYHTEVDRNMLYIACTRAMHRLTVTCAHEVSEFLRTAKG